MTNLEELSELLVSEIEQFEKTVERLQKIQEQKIRIDSQQLEKTIRLQQENLEKVLSTHQQEMKNLSQSLEKAKGLSYLGFNNFCGIINFQCISCLHTFF